MSFYNRYTPAAFEVDQTGYPDFEKDPDYYVNWWDTQFERCIMGYEPNPGDWIPGDYYFQLNFMKGEVMDKGRADKTIQRLPYNDCDHELHLFLNQCDKDSMGAIVMKSRRTRFTTNMSAKLLSRFTFFPGSIGGVGTYEKDHHEKVHSVISIARSHLPLELSYYVKDDPELLIATRKQKSRVGWKEEGSFSQIHFATFGGRKLNTGAFRRLSLKIALFDEIGANPVLTDCRLASEECWKDGDDWYGLPVFGGTADEMKNPSPDLKEFCYNPEKYNCRLHFIPKQRFYWAKATQYFDPKTRVASPTQQESARKYIAAIAQEKYKLENKKEYYMWLQENPTTLEECFMGGSLSQVLPMDKVNHQIKIIKDRESLGQNVMRFDIHWKDNRYNPAKPEIAWLPKKDGEVWIMPGCMPDENYRGLDIAGVDTYYASGAPTSDSIGVMYIFRRDNFFDSNKLSYAPIVEYAARYPTNEAFYEGCFKLAVAYSTPKNTMKILSEFDSTFLMFMEHANALKYFKERPTAIDGTFSKAINRYMVRMTGQAKVKATALLQDYLQEFSENIGFTRLLEDMKKFGVRNTDYVSAFLVTLIHELDMQHIPVERIGDKRDVSDFFPSYKRNEQGFLIPKGIINPDDNINFLRPF